MKFSICNEIFQGWPIEDVFNYAARLGYDGVEIAPFTLADSVTDISANRRKGIRKAAAASGIEIVGLHWLLAKPAGLYINHPDIAVRRSTSKYLTDLVDFCADLGGRIMVFGSPKQRNVMPDVSPAQAIEWTLETFRGPVARAEQREVIICFEPLGPSETNFINSAAEAVSLVSAMPSPCFRILLDVKAMSFESKPIPEVIRESWPKFAHFHANDKNLKGPGFGEVDFIPIAAALKEVGYAGYVSVEVFDFEEGPEVIASKSLDYLRRVFPDRSVQEQEKLKT